MTFVNYLFYHAEILKKHGEMLRVYVIQNNKKITNRLLKIIKKEKDKKNINKN